MSSPATPSAPAPKGDDRKLVAVDENYLAPTFEDRLRIFWEKNSTAVTVVLVAVLLGIVAKGGWEYLADQREQDTQAAYAAAANPAALNAFISAHPAHPLAGVALLRLADDAYTAGKYTDAISGYDQAVLSLKTGPLASRARLGLAMAKLQAGRTADGVAALKTFANDATEVKAFRVEAAFHLASHAAATNNAADLKTYSELTMQIDPASAWTQHAMQLRAAAPLGDAAPAGDAARASEPTVKLPGK